MSPAEWADQIELAIACHRTEIEWVSASHHRRRHRATAAPYWWRLRAEPRTWFCGVTLVYWHRTGVVPAFHDARRIAELLGMDDRAAVAVACAAVVPAGVLRRKIATQTANVWEVALVEGVARGYARWWRIGGRKTPQVDTPGG
jgi:hypothetical protein